MTWQLIGSCLTAAVGLTDSAHFCDIHDEGCGVHSAKSCTQLVDGVESAPGTLEPHTSHALSHSVYAYVRVYGHACVCAYVRTDMPSFTWQGRPTDRVQVCSSARR